MVVMLRNPASRLQSALIWRNRGAKEINDTVVRQLADPQFIGPKFIDNSMTYMLTNNDSAPATIAQPPRALANDFVFFGLTDTGASPSVCFITRSAASSIASRASTRANARTHRHD